MDSLPSELDDYSILDHLLGEETEVRSYKLTLMQKFMLKLFGKVFVRKYKDASWSDSLPFYLFRCPEHGLQLSYPMGWNKKLICLKCLV